MAYQKKLTKTEARRRLVALRNSVNRALNALDRRNDDPHAPAWANTIAEEGQHIVGRAGIVASYLADYSHQRLVEIVLSRQ